MTKLAKNQKRSFKWKIAKKTGPPTEGLYFPFLLSAEYPDGTNQEIGLIEQDAELVEKALLNPDLWKNFLSALLGALVIAEGAQ